MSWAQWIFLINGILALVNAIVLTVRSKASALYWYLFSGVLLFAATPTGAGLGARQILRAKDAVETGASKIWFIIIGPFFVLAGLLLLWITLTELLPEAFQDHSWSEFVMALCALLFGLIFSVGVACLWWSTIFG
jgi:ACR3 family arsenite efflux pump ArsB